IHPTADADNYSLAKYCNYGLASNVDTLVTAVDVRHLTPIVLDENSTTAPAAASGVNVRVLRTIKANEWGTICLPFAMTAEQVTAAFGPDVKLSDFTGYTATKAANGNTIDITVNFSPVTPLAVAANHPYIIKVSNGVTEFSVKDVNIVPAEPTINRGTEDEPKAIVGTYVADTTVPNLCLFLNGGNFYYSKGLTRMKGFRAYFDFYDVLTSVANSSNAGAKIGLNIEGETTSLNEELRMKSEESVGEWYSIDGRKLNGEPTRKGVYIRDGRKVVVK
ncbi:MAG: hypothetical protein IKS72_08230, partial [Prevotella sp.]|nr:hypothetical protein [Prevotella sp.]